MFVRIIILIAFFLNGLGPMPARAADLVLPKPGVMVHLSSEFTPAYLSGVSIHPEDALQFDFLINRGDEILSEEEKKEEYAKLVKYFLASLTVPDQDQWVNLSPYEKDRIIEDSFGKTEMGRDLLAQDYILKQITSSLIYPEEQLGKKFWDKIYERAWKEYGSTNVPVNTFNKVWIVPDEAVVYESGNTAYVLKSHLKVMLEEDYEALNKNKQKAESPKGISIEKDTHTLGSQIVREIILPELEREVNQGKNFANLRQIYSGMILATWYKKALKESLLGKVYADKAKVKGVDQPACRQAGTTCVDNEQIYQEYLKAFKKGVFNYIKEDVDKYTKQSIPRKYFSGGFRKAVTGKGDLAMRVFKKGQPLPQGVDSAAVAGQMNATDGVTVVLRTDAESDEVSQGQSIRLREFLRKDKWRNIERIEGNQYSAEIPQEVLYASIGNFLRRTTGRGGDIVRASEEDVMQIVSKRISMISKMENRVIKAKYVEIENEGIKERVYQVSFSIDAAMSSSVIATTLGLLLSILPTVAQEKKGPPLFKPTPIAPSEIPVIPPGLEIPETPNLRNIRIQTMLSEALQIGPRKYFLNENKRKALIKKISDLVSERMKSFTGLETDRELIELRLIPIYLGDELKVILDKKDLEALRKRWEVSTKPNQTKKDYFQGLSKEEKKRILTDKDYQPFFIKEVARLYMVEVINLDPFRYSFDSKLRQDVINRIFEEVFKEMQEFKGGPEERLQKLKQSIQKNVLKFLQQRTGIDRPDLEKYWKEWGLPEKERDKYLPGPAEYKGPYPLPSGMELAGSGEENAFDAAMKVVLVDNNTPWFRDSRKVGAIGSLAYFLQGKIGSLSEGNNSFTISKNEFPQVVQDDLKQMEIYDFISGMQEPVSGAKVQVLPINSESANWSFKIIIPQEAFQDNEEEGVPIRVTSNKLLKTTLQGINNPDRVMQMLRVWLKYSVKDIVITQEGLQKRQLDLSLEKVADLLTYVRLNGNVIARGIELDQKDRIVKITIPNMQVQVQNPPTAVVQKPAKKVVQKVTFNRRGFTKIVDPYDTESHFKEELIGLVQRKLEASEGVAVVINRRELSEEGQINLTNAEAIIGLFKVNGKVVQMSASGTLNNWTITLSFDQAMTQEITPENLRLLFGSILYQQAEPNSVLRQRIDELLSAPLNGVFIRIAVAVVQNKVNESKQSIEDLMQDRKVVQDLMDTIWEFSPKAKPLGEDVVDRWIQGIRQEQLDQLKLLRDSIIRQAKEVGFFNRGSDDEQASAFKVISLTLRYLFNKPNELKHVKHILHVVLNTWDNLNELDFSGHTNVWVKARLAELKRDIGVLSQKVDALDFAMGTVEEKVGGIDFNSTNLNLQIKRNGQGVPLPLAQQDMTQLNQIEGFRPVIIEIKPAAGLPIFSELQIKFQESQTS